MIWEFWRPDFGRIGQKHHGLPLAHEARCYGSRRDNHRGRLSGSCCLGLFGLSRPSQRSITPTALGYKAEVDDLPVFRSISDFCP